MKERWQRSWAIGLTAGAMLSLLGLFNITQPNIETELQVVKHGATLLCDESVGTVKSICVATYSRGWPIASGDGFLTLSSDGRNAHQFELSPLKLVFNSLLLSIPATLIAQDWLRRQTE